MVSLRPAKPSDERAIRSLVRQAQLNPLGLDWRRFVVAVDQDDEGVIGCGQIKPHRDGSQELASIVVARDCRGQGVGTAIIQRLLENHPRPIYLTCRSGLRDFYQRFGFRVVRERGQMPRYFRWVSRLFRLLDWIGLLGEGLLVMKRN